MARRPRLATKRGREACQTLLMTRTSATSPRLIRAISLRSTTCGRPAHLGPGLLRNRGCCRTDRPHGRGSPHGQGADPGLYGRHSRCRRVLPVRADAEPHHPGMLGDAGHPVQGLERSCRGLRSQHQGRDHRSSQRCHALSRTDQERHFGIHRRAGHDRGNDECRLDAVHRPGCRTARPVGRLYRRQGRRRIVDHRAQTCPGPSRRSSRRKF